MSLKSEENGSFAVGPVGNLAGEARKMVAATRIRLNWFNKLVKIKSVEGTPPCEPVTGSTKRFVDATNYIVVSLKLVRSRDEGEKTLL